MAADPGVGAGSQSAAGVVQTGHTYFNGKIIGFDIFLSGFTGKTWDDDVDYVRGWLGRRLAWLNSNLPGTCR